MLEEEFQVAVQDVPRQVGVHWHHTDAGKENDYASHFIMLSKKEVKIQENII